MKGIAIVIAMLVTALLALIIGIGLGFALKPANAQDPCAVQSWRAPQMPAPTGNIVPSEIKRPLVCQDVTACY